MDVRIAAAMMLIALCTTLPIAVYGQTEVEGTLSFDSALFVADRNNRTIGVYPSDIYVEFAYIRTEYRNETLPGMNGSVDANVAYKRWWWVVPPGEPLRSVYLPEIDARVGLDYDIALNAVANFSSRTVNTSSGVVTVYNGSVSISLEVRIHVTFLTPPNTSGEIPLGDLLRKHVFNGYDPVLGYEVGVELTYPDGSRAYLTYTDNVILKMENLSFYAYSVRFWIDEVERTGYVEKGDLNSTASIAPRYDVKVCGAVAGGSYDLVLFVEIGSTDGKLREAVLAVDSDPIPDCAYVRNVTLVPGNSSNVIVVLRSGAFVLNITQKLPIEGYVVAALRPTGRAVGRPGEWRIRIGIPVSVGGYFETYPAITLKAEVEDLPLDCRMLTVSEPGTYTVVCNGTLRDQITAPELAARIYKVTLTVIDDLGNVHEFSGVATLEAMDPSNVADQAWEAYNLALSIVSGGIVAVLLLMIFSIIKESITGVPLFDIVYLRGVLLMMLVIALVLEVGIPMIYRTFVNLLANIPLFQKYIDPIQSNDPKEVFKEMIEYYDKLFQSIEEGYQKYFVEQMNEALATVARFVMIATALLLAAIGIAWLIGASIPWASFGGSILMIAFSFLGTLLMFAPEAATVIVAIAVGRLIILFATVIVLALMVLGVALLCIPSPNIQRFGEDFFGAGLLYFVTMPILGPITYAMYNYVVDVAVQNVAGAISLSLGVANLFIPIKPLAVMMVYFVASGAAVVMIAIAMGYILSRTGVAASIGELFSSLIWRG